MGREVLFPANPDLAGILGDMDLDFENFIFSHFLDSKFLHFQIARFPKSGPWPSLGRAGPGLSHLASGLGRARPGPGLSWARREPPGG